jgi:hypothetical protein
VSLATSSGDTGSGQTGVSLSGHAGGNGAGVTAGVTVGHTVLLILGALAILWLLGAGVFKSIRMH